MTTVLSSRLTLSALAAASSFIALASPVQAQSLCTLSGLNVLCADGSVTATIAADADTTITLPLQGVTLVDPTTLAANATGTLNTNGALPALTVTSLGNLSVGNTGGSLAINATGSGTGATLAAVTGNIANTTLGAISTVNNYGLYATAATGAAVTTGSITATNVNQLGIVLPASAVLSAAADSPSGSTLTIGSGAGVQSTTGDAALTVNGNVNVTGSVSPLIGVFSYAPTGAASTTVNGAVTLTSTGNNGNGVIALGQTGATVRVTGATLVSGAGATGLSAYSLGNTSLTCGSVGATGAGAIGATAIGSAVTVNCGNITTTGTYTVGLNGAGSTSLVANVGTVTANGDNSIAVRINDPALATIGTVNLTTGNITTTGAGSVGLLVSGSSIAATTGTVTTTGAGIRLTSPGAITLTSGAVTTSGATAPGVVALGGTGAVQLTTGAVTTTGATSNGVFATTTTGNLTVNTGKLTTTGAGLTTQTTNGTQLLTVAGTQSVGNGINATATGTGAITVNATAPVVSTAGYGINVAGNTGAVAVTTNGVAGALGGVRVVNSGTGNAGVTVATGTTTATAGDAIQLTTLGTATTTVAAGATVRGVGTSDAIDTRGTLANVVNVSGTVAADATGNAINATGGAATVTINAGGSVTGPVSLTANNDTIVNAGGFTPTGTVAFGAGIDVLTNSATGTLNLTQGATLTGLETLTNNGTVNAVGTTTLTGTTFGNNAGASVVVTGGAATLAGLTQFNNAGLITMVDGAANDSLTLGGSYAGTGAARLAVDVDGALNTADKLVVNGNVTGSTVIDVNLVGSTPLYNPTGVIVVDATGTVSTGAFTLAAGDTQLGLLNYGLRQVGNDTFLSSTLDSSFTDIALAGSLGRDLWYQSFDAYHDAIMGRHAGSLVTGNNIGIWGQLYESKDRYGDANRSTMVNGTSVTYSDQLRTHRRGGQVGLEFRGTGFVIGATGGYEWARSEDQPIASRLKAEGYNYGAYAHFGMASGLYAGVLVKRDDYHIDFGNDARLVNFRNNAHSTGVDGEVGLKTAGAGSAIAFDLNAGVSYVDTDIDAWNQYGLTFDWQNNKSLRGRLGARVLFPSAWGAFVGAKVMHEFKDDGYLRVAGTTTVADVDLAHRGTWVRLEGGLSGIAGTGGLITVWGDLGETKSFGARLGFAF